MLNQAERHVRPGHLGRAQKRLVLARDPFGIKLIYYRVDGKRLYFGSEIRAVRAAMPDKAEIDPTSLNLFLRYRYTPSPYTIVKGVNKLAPGTKTTVENGSFEVSRWYQFKPIPFSPAKSADEAKEELLDPLQAGDEAATDQRCASGIAVERRHGFGAVVGPDESLRQRVADLHSGIWIELRR